MKPMMARSAGVLRVWGRPAAVAAVTALGLLSALFGDGVWDALSWFALGAPLLIIGWHVTRSLAGCRW
jgi:hypothetical protein